MSWYPRDRRALSRFPPNLNIRGDNYAVVQFLEEPRVVNVQGEDRFCVNVRYVEGTATYSDRDGKRGDAVPGEQYTLWLPKTLRFALADAFADRDNPDEPPKIKGKYAKIWRGRYIRNSRVYMAEQVKPPLLAAAEPKVEADFDKYVDAFASSFKVLGEVTLKEMDTWFRNKFGDHPPVDKIATYMVKRGLAEFDGEKLKAL